MRHMKTTAKYFAAIGLFLVWDTGLHAQTTRPDAEKKLAREIYKEFVEIQSGYTTGATTPVAEATAARLKAAGFPASIST